MMQSSEHVEITYLRLLVALTLFLSHGVCVSGPTPQGRPCCNEWMCKIIKRMHILTNYHPITNITSGPQCGVIWAQKVTATQYLICIWEIKSQRKYPQTELETVSCTWSQHYANLSPLIPGRSLDWITPMQISSAVNGCFSLTPHRFLPGEMCHLSCPKLLGCDRAASW